MWTEENNCLRHTFLFKTFEDAMSFMQEAATEIALQDHHPEWSNVYNKVEVVLRTHSAGNTVTEKDHKLAAVLDTIYCHYL